LLSLSELLERISADSIPNLATGTCILAGLMAKIPVVIKVDEIKERRLCAMNGFYCYLFSFYRITLSPKALVTFYEYPY
jgi:hypothetical protein